jgi:hypothetical protein
MVPVCDSPKSVAWLGSRRKHESITFTLNQGKSSEKLKICCTKYVWLLLGPEKGHIKFGEGLLPFSFESFIFLLTI